MVSYYHHVLTHPHQSLCSHSSHVPCPHILCSPHLILPTDASPLHHKPSPPLSHPSCLHHIIITSSHRITSTSHQSLPLPPHNTPQPSQSSPNSSRLTKIPIPHLDAPLPIPTHTKPIQSRRWDKPQGLAGQSQLIPSQYPLHTKSSTKDCTDNTISFNTIQIVFLYPKRIKYSYVKYILSL